MKKARVGISSCLLGARVRYDGGHKLNRFIAGTLGKYFQWVPVCPEVEYGLPVPREEMRLEGDPDAPRLVTIRSGFDHTAGLLRWTSRRIRDLRKKDLDGFIFKAKSPSCGIKGVDIYVEEGKPFCKGKGLFAGEFIKAFPLAPVEDESSFHDSFLRENFIERIFAHRRLKDLFSHPNQSESTREKRFIE